jgi:hypothetical protein
MTKLLDQVLAKVRALPEEEQDQIAELVAAVLQHGDTASPLTDEQVEEVKRTQEAVRRGEVATDEEMDELWRRFGLA